MRQTKDMIVETFMEMLDEMPYNKITVRGIVQRCGISRNTFYYHFADIPELMETSGREWINQIFTASFQPDSPMGCLAPIFEYGSAHRNALLHLYRSVNREVFVKDLNRFGLYISTQFIENAEAGLSTKLNPHDKLILTRYYKCSFVGVVLDWLESGMSYDLLSAASRLCELLAGSAEEAFIRSAEKKM